MVMSTRRRCRFLDLTHLCSCLYLTMLATCSLLSCVVYIFYGISSSASVLATSTATASLESASFKDHGRYVHLMCSMSNITRVQYVAVIDAGSTGSRIHVYQFEKDDDGSFRFQLEIYFEVSPGLSAYAFTPTKGANSIRPLLEVAKLAVPRVMWRQTPLVIKATAGLRLLTSQVAHSLLNEVYKILLETDFLLPPDAVEVIDGIAEGFFGWMTVNYLIGAFNKQGKLAVSMDLGGGSTQLSLVPTHKGTISSLPPEDLQNIYLFNSHYKVYTHSYLGLGLISARFQMMDATEGGEDSPYVKDRILKSSCLPSQYEGVLKHGPNIYSIRGMDPVDTGFTGCYKSALQVLSGANIRVVPEMKQMTIYAFAYYFDIAVDAKLIDKHGGVLKITDYKNAALKECSSHGEHRFLCMDLTYIYTLLRAGFQLDDSTVLHVKHIENGGELSWSLGMAYHILSSVIDV
ncbi:ectonucleoside triphosphate diphosphohydrolase 5-like isoform X2 [Gigantopelta aegis]|uniref:ectonucleoside triphosphate diphosphohydrolase 5-like isoform X2 n=1 Tax=Gigantopelta aegis TaxID=1735272 RepID=UPI001B88B5F4|nr:ectonucleoside triphosphate diphosphohydrolase 5-like isoform X2 [Gigantopelta aegis]